MEKLDKKLFWGASFFLLVVSALVYLPKITNLGYYNDDWYLMYDAYTQGPSIYHEVFSSDRPLRAYVMISAYHLFGFNPVYYNLSAFFFRVLSAVGFLWTLRLLWPQKKRATLAMALLFLIYPGFLSQHNGIDYQSQIISLAFALFSVALTLKAVLAEQVKEKILYFLLSLFLGWIYLGLVEYFIGFEVLRFGIIILLAIRRKEKLFEAGFLALREGWVFLLISFTFLFWHVFLFENVRKATSLASQFGVLFASPIHTGLWWIVYLVQGFLDVVFLAWAVPFHTLAFTLRLRDFLTGAGLASLFVFIVLSILSRTSESNDEHIVLEKLSDWKKEALWLGALSTLGGILPIIMVNRHIDFFDYSRYTLGGAAGGAMIIIALLYFIKSTYAKTFLFGLIIFSAFFAHYANATKLALNTEATNNFWWQMSWRAPQIAEGTTMVIEYPLASLSEDYIIWGAANLLYYPELPDEIPLRTRLSALLLTPDHINNIRTEQRESSSNGRGYQSLGSFSNILVAAQSTPNGCVRIFDGEQPNLSSLDSYRIQLVAPYSQAENILVNAQHKVPLEIVFGAEPAHRWCYYYQKSDLARQRNDWDAVIELQEKALSEGYYPNDSIEWFPLLEAYTFKGEKEKLRPYISILREEPLLMKQACQTFLNTAQSEDMKSYINNKFCE